jgi:hypothetical protein
LPDISELNGTAIDNVAEFDGLTVTEPVAAPAAAYSVRLLGSGVGVPTYTGAAMRVRRDTAGGTGDDDEADVAFDTSLATPTISLDSAISNASAGVTATTLGQFLNVGTVGGTTYTNPDSLSGTASCFVDEWKDQSGNANHASQATFGSQPQIHDGTVDTDLITENGKPAIKPTSAIQLFNFSVAASSAGVTFFNVVRVVGGTTSSVFVNGSFSSQYIGAAQDGSTSTIVDQVSGNVSYRINEAAVTPADRNALHDALATGNHLLSIYTDITTAFTNYIGYDNVGVWMYQLQEFVAYRSDEFTGGDLSGIETNISTYFSTP